MTAIPQDTHTTPAHRPGEPVTVHQHGQMISGWIVSVHQTNPGVEYVVRTVAADGGLGGTVNVFTTSGRSAYLAPADAGQAR